MPANIPHRIDTAQRAVPPTLGPARARVGKAVNAGLGVENSVLADENQASFRPTPRQDFVQGEQIEGPLQRRNSDFETERVVSADLDPDAWLRAHATDLIGHLQNWSSELDRRESGLNARIAMHESRERRFRLQRSELAGQLAESQARVDQLRQQLEARARRLAFENHS